MPLIIVTVRESIAGVFGLGNSTIPGIDQAVLAVLLIVFIIIEPAGVFGRWIKIRTWMQLFPLARKDLFKQSRSYLKTERMR